MKLTRRGWLKLAGLSGAALAPGLLPFVPRAARAQGMASPKRVLCIFHGLGYLENSFWPTPGPSGRADDFTLGETQSALAPHRDQLIYPDGMLLYGAQYFYEDDDNEHGSGGNMTFTASHKEGYSTGPSFEQAIADSFWNADDPVTPYRDIALGISAGTGEHRSAFFRGDQQPIAGANDPADVFEALFGGRDAMDDEAAARRRALDQSVLDHIRGELQSTRRRIGRQEEALLDAHLEHLRALERRVTTTGAVCTTPDAPTGDFGGGDPAKLTRTFEAHVDTLAAAFACDLSRVATLQLGHCDGGLTLVEGLNAHGVSHAVGDTREDPVANAAAKAEHRQLDRFWADRWAYLLAKMASIPDGDGSLLDNTLIVWGTDTSTGESLGVGPHKHWRMPYFMAGGSKWAFPTGRHLRLAHPDGTGRDDGPGWQSNSRLWVSIMQRYGMDVDTFGNMDIGHGTLPGL